MKQNKKSIKTKKNNVLSASSIAAKNIPLATIFSGPIPSKIPSKKWLEIVQDEKIDDLINSVRAEIVQSAINEIYRRYIEKTSYSFMVHCAHLAWLRCFDVNRLKN